MAFRLSVSGPTGAGKSTLALMISQHAGFDLIRESIPKKLFSQFALSPERYCYDLQKQIVQTRAKNIKGNKAQIQIIDRAISEDIEVFFKLHTELGFLTEEQFIDLVTIAKAHEADIGSPDAVVFVTAKPFRLKERMLVQGAPHFLIENIDLQLRHYERWRKTIDSIVLDIENTHLTLNQLQSIANWIYDILPRLQAKEAPRSHFLGLYWKG